MRSVSRRAAAPSTSRPALTGTITLSTGEIAFAKSLTIDGAGASVIVSGSNARIFNETDGTTTLTVRNLTLANGRAQYRLEPRRRDRDERRAHRRQRPVQRQSGGRRRRRRLRRAGAAGTLGSAVIRNSAFSGNSVTGDAAASAAARSWSPARRAGRRWRRSRCSTRRSPAIRPSRASACPAAGSRSRPPRSTMISSTVAGNNAGAAGADLHQGTLANTTVTLTNSIVGAGSLSAVAVRRDRPRSLSARSEWAARRAATTSSSNPRSRPSPGPT